MSYQTTSTLQPFHSLAEVLIPADVLFQTLKGFPLGTVMHVSLDLQ